jgi:hypothetical protein
MNFRNTQQEEGSSTFICSVGTSAKRGVTPCKTVTMVTEVGMVTV